MSKPQQSVEPLQTSRGSRPNKQEAGCETCAYYDPFTCWGWGHICENYKPLNKDN